MIEQLTDGEYDVIKDIIKKSIVRWRLSNLKAHAISAMLTACMLAVMIHNQSQIEAMVVGCILVYMILYVAFSNSYQSSIGPSEISQQEYDILAFCCTNELMAVFQERIQVKRKLTYNYLRSILNTEDVRRQTIIKDQRHANLINQFNPDK